jgi:hypothetical protein
LLLGNFEGWHKGLFGVSLVGVFALNFRFVDSLISLTTFLFSILLFEAELLLALAVSDTSDNDEDTDNSTNDGTSATSGGWLVTILIAIFISGLIVELRLLDLVGLRSEVSEGLGHFSESLSVLDWGQSGLGRCFKLI